MNIIIKFFLLALVLLSAFSCSKSYVSIDQEVDETLDKVVELMAKEKYRRVIEILAPRINQYSGVQGVDSLVYFLGISYVETEDFESGVVQLSRFVDNFRASPLRPYAQYYLGQSYVRRLPISTREQETTKRALAELNTFTELYPDHELMTEIKKDIKVCRNLLAKNIFDIGFFYFRKEDYSPSRAYFSDLLQDFIDTDLSEDARTMLAMSYIKLNDFENAQNEFQLIEKTKVSAKFVEYYDKTHEALTQ